MVAGERRYVILGPRRGCVDEDFYYRCAGLWAGIAFFVLLGIFFNALYVFTTPPQRSTVPETTTTTSTTSTTTPTEEEVARQRHIGNLLNIFPDAGAYTDHLKHMDDLREVALARQTTSTLSPEQILREQHITNLLAIYPTETDYKKYLYRINQLIAKAESDLPPEFYEEDMSVQERRKLRRHIMHLLKLFPSKASYKRFVSRVWHMAKDAGATLPPNWDLEAAYTTTTSTETSTTPTTTSTSTPTTTSKKPYVFVEDRYAHHPLFVCNSHPGTWGVDAKVERLIKHILVKTRTYNRFCKEMRHKKYRHKMRRIKQELTAKVLRTQERVPITQPLPTSTTTRTPTDEIVSTCPTVYCPACRADCPVCPPPPPTPAVERETCSRLFPCVKPPTCPPPTTCPTTRPCPPQTPCPAIKPGLPPPPWPPPPQYPWSQSLTRDTCLRLFPDTATTSSTCPPPPVYPWLETIDRGTCSRLYPCECKLRLKACRKKFPVTVADCSPICLDKYKYNWCA